MAQSIEGEEKSRPYFHLEILDILSRLVTSSPHVCCGQSINANSKGQPGETRYRQDDLTLASRDIRGVLSKSRKMPVATAEESAY